MKIQTIYLKEKKEKKKIQERVESESDHERPVFAWNMGGKLKTEQTDVSLVAGWKGKVNRSLKDRQILAQTKLLGHELCVIFFFFFLKAQ